MGAWCGGGQALLPHAVGVAPDGRMLLRATLYIGMGCITSLSYHLFYAGRSLSIAMSPITYSRVVFNIHLPAALPYAHLCVREPFNVSIYLYTTHLRTKTYQQAGLWRFVRARVTRVTHELHLPPRMFAIQALLLAHHSFMGLAQQRRSVA